MRFPWKSQDDELRRELEHHLAELTDEYIRRGHSEDEAHRLAALEFGGTELIKDQCRDESVWAWVHGLRQDLQFGFRQLKQTPVVTAAAVLSLALGIGANSAIFSLMNTVLWRNLPVAQPEQLSLVHWEGHGFPRHLADSGAGSMFRSDGGQVANFFAMTAIESMKKAAKTKAEMAAYSFSNAASVSFGGRPTIAFNRPVDGNFFQVLAVQPVLGRSIRESDNTLGAAPVAMVSHRFFESFLGSDPKVIGQPIRINNVSYEIVGVLPASFYGLVPGDSAQVYSPLWKSSEFAQSRDGKIAMNDSRSWVTQVLMRRNAGVTEEAIRPILAAAFAQTWEPKGKQSPPPSNPTLRLDDGRRGLGDLSRNFRQPLMVLGGMLALVLLIACANIANLLLARATARAKEVALRISLGCTQGRLLRQFLTESALLAMLSGVASIFVAYAASKGLAYFLTGRDGNGPLPLTIDVPMLAAIALISASTLFVFGLFPAWRASKVDANEGLKEGSGSLGVAARHWWTPGRLLIVGQMSLSILLVCAAVLFAENLRHLAMQDTGFQRGNLLVFGLKPGTSGFTKETLPAFYDELERTLAATPGVESASLATIRPMNQGGWWDDVRELGGSKNYSVAVNSVTASYLSIFMQNLKAGRNFERKDLVKGAAKVAIISEDLARLIDPGNYPIGRKIHTVGDPNGKIEPIEIIGVTPSIAFNSMKDRPHVMWLPFDSAAQDVTVVVKTKASPSQMIPAMREAVQKLSRDLPLVDPFTMEELVARNLQRERMFATLCGSFGVLALLLSVVGLYGVMSYNASRRKTEIGVRLALGAEPGDVTWMVLREAVGLTALGLALGAPALYFGSQFVEKELFELKPLNPLLISISILMLAGAALVASWLPARRAAALDPSTALRQD